MTDYTAVRACSATLRALLNDHITATAEPGLAGVPIDLRSPRELEQANVDTAVSLWLYRIVIDPDVINRQPARPTADVRLVHPTPVELCYLVTPLHPTSLDEHTLLGRIVQVLHDHAKLAGSQLRDSLATTSTVLRLSFDITTVADTNNLWWSLQSQHRVAVACHVDGVVLDSHMPAASGAPVLTRQTTHTQIVGVS
jgi:Pvc16 N-terminal domain